MKTTLLALAGVTTILSFAQAGTILGTNINGAVGDTLIANSSNIALSSGTASSGYFTVGFDLNGAIASNDFAAISANFVTLTSSALGETSSDFGTDIAGFYSNPQFEYGAPGALIGTSLYTMFSANGEFGLVSFPITIDADTPTPDSNSLNLFTGGNYTVLIGQTGSTVSVDLSALNIPGVGTVTNPTLRLVAIPEPSAIALGALGALGLLRRRR